MGSSEFVQSLWDEVNEREKETLRLRKNLTDLPSLAREIGREEGITEAELRSGSRKKKIRKARRRFCQLAVVKLGYPGAQVARFLGAVMRAANSEELPRLEADYNSIEKQRPLSLTAHPLRRSAGVWTVGKR